MSSTTLARSTATSRLCQVAGEERLLYCHFDICEEKDFFHNANIGPIWDLVPGDGMPGQNNQRKRKKAPEAAGSITPIYLSIYLSINLSITYLDTFIYLTLYPTIFELMYLSMHPAAYQLAPMQPPNLRHRSTERMSPEKKKVKSPRAYSVTMRDGSHRKLDLPPAPELG